jgi:hypothetical protein
MGVAVGGAVAGTWQHGNIGDECREAWQVFGVAVKGHTS